MPPDSIDAHFTYPELRDLDDALDRLNAASRAVDVAVRSMSAPAVTKSYQELRAATKDHRETTLRILSAARVRAGR